MLKNKLLMLSGTLSMLILPHRYTLIRIGAYSGHENTLIVVDVDPRFIAEIDPLSTIFCRTWETIFLYRDPPGLLSNYFESMWKN